MLSDKDLSNLIKNQDLSVSFYNPRNRSSKNSKQKQCSDHWNGFLKIFVKKVKQDYILRENCQCL